MPLYICYRGGCENLVYDAERRPVQIVKDALGRQWLCVEIDPSDAGSEFRQSVLGMLEAQVQARRRGESTGVTDRMLVEADDEAALRHLVLTLYPPAAESQTRLDAAGWGRFSLSGGPGGPYRLTVSDGQRARTFQAESEAEAWYRAAQAVAGPAPGAQEKQAMIATGEVIPVPLREEPDGSLRVGESRVLLDLVIEEFNKGADPESIVHAYSSLDLADVYVVLGYYLRNREAVDAYLLAREEKAEQLRQQIESKQPDRRGLRAELLARRARMEQGHGAAPGK
jgi:uncharacterized protein (DUF433 family)